MDVDALAPTRLLDREILLARRPATGGPRRMGRMNRVGEQHGLVVGQRIQQLFIGRDESLLLFLVELIPHLIDQNSCAHWRSPMDMIFQGRSRSVFQACLLYTSDAADDLTRVDLGGRRI